MTPSAAPAYVSAATCCAIVVHVERVDHPDEREESEDVRKDQAQPVHAAEDKLLSQEAHHAVGPRLHQEAVDQSEGRQQQHRDAFGRGL